MTIPIYQRVSAYYHRAAIIILLSGFLMRLFIAIWLNPGFDEAYYYLYTLHPNWSYFDHPPLVAVTTSIGIWLTGQVSHFTIRIGTVLLYTGSLIFLYLATLRLYTLQVAINALAIASAIPVFQLAFGILTTPDTPLLFFWAVSLWLAAQEFFTDRVYRPSYRLTLICLTVGLACLGKYHGFILGLGLAGFCLFSPNFRCALMVILVEMLYLFPTFGFPLLWSVIRATAQQLRNFNWWQGDNISGFYLEWDLEKRALLLWLSVPLILGFTLISGYQQILPGWKMPGYWSATILLAERISINRRYLDPRTLYRWFFGSIGIIILLLSIALAHIEAGTFQTPSKSAILGLLPIKGDNSTQLFDIQQLRQGLSNNPKFSQALKTTDFVFTNRYYLGGQIGMAIEPIFHKPITCFDEDLRGFAFWSKPNQWLGKNAIYLGTKTFEVDLDADKRYPSYFQKMTKLGEVPILRGGEVVETFSVYQAQKLLKPYPRPYGN